MPIRNLNDVTHLRNMRAELQNRLAAFEAGRLEIDLHPLAALSAIRRIKRAIAECDELINRSRPLKAHRDECLHLFEASKP